MNEIMKELLFLTKAYKNASDNRLRDGDGPLLKTLVEICDFSSRVIKQLMEEAKTPLDIEWELIIEMANHC